MTTRVELAVLDMAGTTIDEGQQVYRVLAETANAYGASPSEADIARWHGAAKHEALRALLTPSGGAPPNADLLDAVVADFRARLTSAYAASPPRPLPGITDAMAALRSEGIRIALTTGFDRDIVDSLLAALGWEGESTVDAVVCGSDVAAGRPAPFMIFRAMEKLGVTDVSRVLVAGDTPRDLQAGTNSGAALVVGVLSGADDAVELGRYRHTHLLASVADLPALLEASNLAAGPS
ncbi:HAD family hydrolase [Mycobacterium sp. 1165196.3]|uniref:phosphonatase-like hydrolase n=1 Tax=unclassified Mycobacterium TaxID=2642494 RepID=UPI0007FCD6DD|nr:MULTISPECIES: phosphonatase-like hydrolase [unclassified Mycobacterium]OBJ11812.1 HAD family hydrolase [Mycobacterium sp. 1482292.6]OBK10095.1 HAD family hydrolase [Mycobacterium sp. 1245852.3]OBK35263.1 HAD family hydrolase [Mycobacterium sp. 1165196.3]OBL01386.1 HAD family hydrolase [Mycobacterium sp. 1245499.0]